VSTNETERIAKLLATWGAAQRRGDTDVQSYCERKLKEAGVKL